MKPLLIFLLITMLLLNTVPLLAVEYPVFSIGMNMGSAHSDLITGWSGRAFLRYSLEAYIPGFQIDAGFVADFYPSLFDSLDIRVIPGERDKRMINVELSEFYPAISGTFHLHPFGEFTTVYFGGGMQLHFLSSHRVVKENYWDPVAEKYQEIETEKAELLSQIRPGYHLLGGLRFALGKWGTIDLEARQTFLEVPEDAWEEAGARETWGKESWNNLSLNFGLTIYIF